MLTNNYEIYRYRDSYLNNVALHHHDFYEVYLFFLSQLLQQLINRCQLCHPVLRSD